MGVRVKPTQNIPANGSPAAVWKQWHLTLIQYFGKKTAAAVFVTAWNKRGSTDSLNHDLNEHLEKHGIILDKGLVGTVTEAAMDAGDTIADFLQVGKWVLYGVAGITLAGLAILVFQVTRQPIKTLKAVAEVTPAGRAGKAAKGIGGGQKALNA